MPALQRIALAIPLSLFLAFVSTCSTAKRAAPGRVYDLAALLPLAEVRREAGTIDFGSPEGKEHLALGWYSNERGRDGSTYVWSRGEVSVVEFFLAAPRDLQAELRCAPLRTAEGGPPQIVSVALNGRRLETLELAPGMRGYGVSLPRSALRAGTNRLAFGYRTVSEPSRENGHRRLAVQWDAMRFLPASEPAAEEPRGEPGALFLPFGTEVAFYLDLPAEGDLVLERLDAGGAGGAASKGSLAVTAEVEGGRTAVREIDAGTATHAVRLPGRGPRLLRLALRAVGTPAVGEGLRLAAPAVVAARRRVSEKSAEKNAERHAAVSPRPWSGRPNVIVYLVDTLRADRLGCYGAMRPTSPAVDAFARGATLFERAIAQSTWTRPSVTSVLTGLGPLTHGVTTLDDRLPEAATTLPEILRAAGYRTAGFSTNPQVSAGTGLAQGFDEFELIGGNARSDAVNRRVLDWLDANRGRSPFFLYVHTIDPHAPYEPAPDMLRRFAAGVPAAVGSREGLNEIYRARGEERARLIPQISALYDAEVAANARSFGELLAALRERGLYDPALVLFVADHGEEFDEHGFLGHANNLYSETLDVPLIVKWPRQTRGERIRTPAEQVDLVPTILRAAGLRPPPGLPGTDLYDLARSPSLARRIFSHLSYDGREGVSVVDGDWKLILPTTPMFGAGPELYRLDTDRGERVDLAERDDVRAGWLRAQARGELLRAEAGRRTERAPVDEETRRALHALGYL